MNNLTTSFDILTSTADPFSEYSDWRDHALEVRRSWMELMGLGADEIEEYCSPGQPADLDEELQQYNAILDVQKINANA